MGEHFLVPMDDQRPSVLLRGCAEASLIGMMGAWTRHIIGSVWLLLAVSLFFLFV